MGPQFKNRATLALGMRIAVTAGLCLVMACCAHKAQCAPRPDGDLPAVISGGEDHEIKRWDSSGKLIDRLGMLDDSVNTLSLLAGGVMLSGSADGVLKTWNLTDARETQSLQVSKTAVTSVACTADGSVVAVGSADGQITVWKRATGKKLSETQAHAASVQALLIASDGTLLISGSGDKTIRLWKLAADTGRMEYKSNIAAHDDAVAALAISSDGLMATVSADGYLKTWHLDGGLVSRVKVCDHGVNSVAFSPDGRQIATGDADGRLRIWNTSNVSPVGSPMLHDKDKAVLSVAFGPSGKIIVSGSADKTIRYWSLDSGQKLKTIAAHDGAVKCLVITQ